VKGRVATLVAAAQISLVIDQDSDALFAASGARDNQGRLTFLIKEGT